MRSDLLASERRARRKRAAFAFAGIAAAGALAVAVWPMVMPAPPAVAVSAAATGASAAAGAARASAAGARAAVDDAGDSDGGLGGTARSSAAPLRTRPLSAWLGDIARESGRDLVLSPELRGDLTASESTKLAWKTRLEAYARVAGFAFALGEGIIEVRRGDPDDARPWRRGATSNADAAGDVVATSSAPPSTLAGAGPAAAVAASTAALPADANGTAASSHGASPAESPPPLPETRVLRLAHAPAKETAAVLARSGDALDVTIAADATSNSVVLSGVQPGLGRMLRVLGELDRPRRRIHLEAKIIEVTRSARLDLGVEWKLTGTDVGGDVKFPPNVSDAGSAALVIATHGAAALDARISALEADGKLHVVSRPSVEMLEGSPATIESVRILRIRLPSNGTVVGDEVVSSPSGGRATEDIPVGVRLEVTPAIRGGTRVLLRIRAKSSNLGAPLPPDDIPEELSRMVDAEVLVASGETAILGGLQREAGQNADAGVPVLRKVPGLGRLFGKKSNVGSEEELLVLVTPRVLD